MESTNHQEAARKVFEDVFNRGDFELANELFTDDFIAYAFPELRGPEGIETIVTGFRDSFSDIEWTIETLFGEDEFVAVRWTASGTHDGEFRDHGPTGTTVEIPGTTILRFEDTGAVEGWTIFDELGLLQQIGAIDSGEG
jgi:predicted ester cyclase